VLGITAFWFLLAVLCLPLDLPLARAAHAELVPGDLRALFHRAEVFGHAYGALAILVTVWLLDPLRRRHTMDVGLSFVIAGLTSDVIKLQFWRLRPRTYLESGAVDSTFVGSLWSTLWREGQVDWSAALEASQHSFPSAHTASAVALAVSLGRLYPAGRRWFFVLAGLCAMNRIDGGAHFASDVAAGAGLGYLIAVSLPRGYAFANGVGLWWLGGSETAPLTSPHGLSGAPTCGAPCFAHRLRSKMSGVRRLAATRL
jgi:membrane-associated phospholipid phosphatase